MRVLSGAQPTGKLHIGNYLGAIKQWLELQQKNECIFFITDLHAITIPRDPKTFQKEILNTAVAYLAAGLDPEKSIIFIQSRLKEHTELCWLLNTITPVGELFRMTQYKDKSKQFKKNINAGLLDYPVLQAADILLYQTELVPVGKDQLQHLELSRIIARKFNHRFGKTFKIPKAYVSKTGAKIMSLENPKKKMSKSIPSSCLFLFDEPKEIKAKIMSATTDSQKTIKYDLKRKPGISNLLTIYSLFSDKSIKELEKQFKGKGYAEFKKSLAQLLILKLEPFRTKKKELLSREAYIHKILNKGEKRARAIAQPTMTDVRQKMGLTI
ncbi:tryptophanyl-tRNA synthetase [Parcubacteria bacterium DG_74_2]|nr:MAG: tryptophanyl-tRNA synthetase [Parcubacteria bacterium DG_74_2]